MQRETMEEIEMQRPAATKRVSSGVTLGDVYSGGDMDEHFEGSPANYFASFSDVNPMHVTENVESTAERYVSRRDSTSSTVSGASYVSEAIEERGL